MAEIGKGRKMVQTGQSHTEMTVQFHRDGAKIAKLRDNYKGSFGTLIGTHLH